MTTPPRDFAEWMRLMERKVFLANRSGNANLARELRYEMQQVREGAATAADTRTPAAPIEFTTSTSVRTSDTGRPYSEATIDFSDVTVATDATPITVDYYELWGRDESGWNGTGTPPTYYRKDTSAVSSFLSGPYKPGAKWRFKVRAIGQGMLVPGAWGAEQVLTMVADSTPPSIPPAPVLSQELGVVELSWDGKAAGGTAMQADFAYIEIAMGPASQPTELLPDTLSSAGSIFITGLPYNEVRYFRMRSVDWSGNKSNWSGDASISRVPLVSGDISGLDTTIQEQTEAAQAAEANALQAAQDAQTAAQNAAASATTATNAQTAATTAQSAAQAAADDAAAVQAAADATQAAADEAAASAAAAEARIMELAGLGGRVWMQEDAPPNGVTYEWTGAQDNSTSVTKDASGAVTRTNLALKASGTVAVDKGWYGTGTNFTAVDTGTVSDKNAGIVRLTKTLASGAVALRTPTAAIVKDTPVTFSVRVKTDVALTGISVRIRTYLNGSSATSYETVSNPTVSTVAGEWTTISRTVTLAGTTTGDQMGLVLWHAGSVLFAMDATDPTIEQTSVLGEHFNGNTPDERSQDLWIDIDDGNKQYRWNDGWVEASDESVAAAAQAAQDAQAAAAASASAATAAQTAATNAQNSASASATIANEAQAEAEASAAAALASQNAANQAAADADAAAQAAGSSSAAALQAEQAAEAANLAADAAVDTVQSYILGGDTMIVNGNFDAPITSPPLGWPTRVLTYNEASATTARSGSQVLRATPTTATIAYAYTDYFAAYTGQILYIEYYVRLREALKSGNSAQQLGAYVSCRNVAGTATVYSPMQNNGAPAVTLASLSTTTWTKVAVTQTLTPADIKDVRVGPRIPAVTTAGQNFEIDDFRVVDITQAKAALDAAAAAQTTANTANSAAGSAQSTANSALNAATHSSKNLFSVDPPSGTAPLNTIWFRIDGTGKVIGQWQQTAGDANTDGGTWTKRDIESAVIANVDVGKLTGGFIDATHIETRNLLVGTGATLGSKVDTLDSWKSATDATYIDGGKLYTASVKAAQIDVTNLAADTGFIGQIKTNVLTADAVTATVLKADAITSKHTITGATFQTTATASRGIKITSTGITGWDSTGAQTLSVSATTGKVSIIGRSATGSAGEAGTAMIPAADSYNGNVCAFYFTADGSFPGGDSAGLWIEDPATKSAQNINIRGHYGGHVEVQTGHLYIRGSGTAVGNFSNWAIGNRTTNGTNYLPNLMIQPAAGTGYFCLVNAPTTSSTANTIIATNPAGVFYKVSSALKYKADVQDWTPELRALQLQPRSWVDRNPMDKADPFQRYFGFIAEEVEAVLPELVVYNEFNEPESVQYDRFPVAIIPVLKNLAQRIEALEGA
jgi:hypothetical protein